MPLCDRTEPDERFIKASFLSLPMATKRGSKSGSSTKASVSVAVALVGDGGVGKTCLLLSYLSGRCPSEYLPGPADWHSGEVTDPLSFIYPSSTLFSNAHSFPRWGIVVVDAENTPLSIIEESPFFSQDRPEHSFCMFHVLSGILHF